MKKRVAALVLVFVMALSLCVPAFAANVRTVWTDITYRGISIVINGIQISPCDEKGNSTEPFIMNDTTYLPVRAIAGALGLNVGWEPSTSTVVLESGGEANYGSGNPTASFNVKHVEITYRGTKISLDGENIPLVNRNGQSVEPFIYNGSNYLPLRVVSEALGLSVGWDGATSTVTLKGSQTIPEPDPEPLPDGEGVLRPRETKFFVGYTGQPDSFQQFAAMKYSYDAAGRLTRLDAGDSIGSLVCSYDGSGRLTSATLNIRGDSRLYNFVYDSEGSMIAYYINSELVEGYIATFDGQGRVIKEEKVLEDGSSGAFEYTYDEAGRLATSKNYDKWGGLNYIGYVYDSEGRLSVRKEFSGDPNVFNDSNITKYLFTYDEAGNLVKEEACETGTDRVVRTKTFSHDAKGRVIADTEFVLDTRFDSEFKTANYYENFYTLDDAGNIVERVFKAYNATMDGNRPDYEYKQASETTEKFEYDSEGRKTLEKQDNISYEWNSSDGYENTWAYDGAGQLVEKSTREYGDGKSDIKRVEKYAYDSEGRTIEERYSSYFNGEFEGEYFYTYKYSDSGELLENIQTNTEGVVSYSFICECDEFGRVISAVAKEYDNILSTESVEYNEEGLPVRSEYVSVSEGVTSVSEMSYGLVKETEQAPFLAKLLEEFQNGI